MASSTGQSGTGRTLRIIAPCRSVAEFLEAFRGYARQRSIFIPTANPRRAGTTGRFRIELETGESLLIGNGTVVEAFSDATNSFGGPGMKIEFSSVDDRGDKVLGQFDPTAAPANGGAKRPDCTLLEETITTMAFPALGLTPGKTGEPERSETLKAPAQTWQPPALRSVPSIPVKKADPPGAAQPVAKAAPAPAPTLKPVPAPAPLPRPVPAPAPAPRPAIGARTIMAPPPAPAPAPVAEAKPPANVASRPAPVPPPPGLARRPTPSPVTPLPGLTRRRPGSLPGVAPAAPEPAPAATPFLTVIGEDYGKAPIEARGDSNAGPKLVPNPPKLPVKEVPPDAADAEQTATENGWGDIDDWRSSTTDPYDAIGEPEPTRRDRQSPLISGELESPAVLPDAATQTQTQTQTRPDVRALEDESPTETTSAPPESRDAIAETMPMAALVAPSAGITPLRDPDHDTQSDTLRASQPAPVVQAAMPPPVPVYPVARDHGARQVSAFENAPTATDPVPGTGMVVKTAAVSGIIAMVIGLVMGYLIWGGRSAARQADTAASAQGATAAEAPRAPAAATAEPERPAPDKAPAPATTPAPEPAAAAAKARPDPEPAAANAEPEGEPEPDPAEAAGENVAAAQPDPAAAAATSCTVAVSSRPPGAMVFAGKKKLGVTPFEGAAPCGQLELKLRKKYYQDAASAVTAQPGEPQKVAVTLERRKATVRVVSIPAGATVSVNGKRAGPAPHSLTLPAGTRVKLKLDKPGFKPWSRSLTVDKSTRLEAKLDPEARPKPKPTRSTKPARPRASNRRSQRSP